MQWSARPSIQIKAKLQFLEIPVYHILAESEGVKTKRKKLKWRKALGPKAKKRGVHCLVQRFLRTRGLISSSAPRKSLDVVQDTVKHAPTSAGGSFA